VPATRSADYAAALKACQSAGPVLTQQASGVFDCPTVDKLEEAARENVLNNMTSLLVLGGASLLMTLIFWLRDRRTHTTPNAIFGWGFGAAVVLWLVGWVTLYTMTEPFVHTAHFVAAVGLFVCVVVVTFANALRRRPGVMTLVGRLEHLDRYAIIGWAMLLGLIVTGSLMLAHLATLFWLEVVVITLFAVFWFVQSLELIDTTTPAAGTPAPPTQPKPQPDVVAPAS